MLFTFTGDEHPDITVNVSIMLRGELAAEKDGEFWVQIERREELIHQRLRHFRATFAVRRRGQFGIGGMVEMIGQTRAVVAAALSGEHAAFAGTVVDDWIDGMQ